MSVVVAPTLGKHDYGDKLILKAQSSAVIEVPFTASPEPSVEWKYKNARLTDTRRYSVLTNTSSEFYYLQQCRLFFLLHASSISKTKQNFIWIRKLVTLIAY